LRRSVPSRHSVSLRHRRPILYLVPRLSEISGEGRVAWARSAADDRAASLPELAPRYVETERQASKAASSPTYQETIMAWITVQVAQNGNSSVRYRMSAFTGMSVFDSVAAGPEVSVGLGTIRIFTHEVRLGPSHLVGVETIGPDATTFRIRGGLQV
jgi:hypothetical protein